MRRPCKPPPPVPIRGASRESDCAPSCGSCDADDTSAAGRPREAMPTTCLPPRCRPHPRCRRHVCRGADRPAMPTKRLPRCGEGTGGRVADWPHGPPRKRGADGSGECPAKVTCRWTARPLPPVPFRPRHRGTKNARELPPKAANATPQLEECNPAPLQRRWCRSQVRKMQSDPTSQHPENRYIP